MKKDPYSTDETEPPPGFIELYIANVSKDGRGGYYYDNSLPNDRKVWVRLSGITGVSTALADHTRLYPVLHVQGFDEQIIVSEDLERLAKKLGAVPSILQEIERLLGMKA